MKLPALIYAGRALLVVAGVLGMSWHSLAASLREEFLVSKWETEDGLPENSATDMVQTPEGFLWFGTFNGLVRTDGQQLDIFQPATTPGLPGAAIINLHLQPTFRLWISTDKGLASLDNGVWRRHGEHTSWSNRLVRTFSERGRGPVLVTSFDGAIAQLDGDKLVEMPAPLPPGAQGAGFRGHVGTGGTLWALRYDYFGRWDGERWVAVAAEGVTNDFRSSLPARDGGLWVITKSKLIKLRNGSVESTVPLSLPIEAVWSTFEEVAGTLWVASHQNGLYRVRPTGEVTHYTMADGLTYNSLRFAFRDRVGVLWVGTTGGGLMRLRPRTFHTFDTETSLPVRVVKSVAEESPGQMLLATYGGGVQRLEIAGAKPVSSTVARGIGYAQSILVDRLGRRWTGFYDSPMALVSGTEVRHIAATNSGGLNVSALFEDAAGRVWIGGNESVARQAEGQFERVPGPGGKPIPGVRGFAQNPLDASVWAVNGRGLFRWASNTCAEVTGPLGGALAGGNCLHFEADGTLWVGTAEAGLLRRQGTAWAAVTARHGLPADTVGAILQDAAGNFWVATTRGVVRATAASLSDVAEKRTARLDAQLFGVTDGMASMECPTGFQPTATRDSAGRLWFATLKGVAMVDPTTVVVSHPVLRTVLVSASYEEAGSERTILLKSPGTVVQVPPGSTQFGVNFVAPGAYDPQRVKFRVQWRRAGQLLAENETPRNYARATLLPPGAYTVQAVAANRHGVWSTEPAELAFVLLPHYWQTLGFRLSAGLAGVAAVLAGLLTLRRVELNKRNEKLEHERAIAREQARLASVMEGTTDCVAFVEPDLRVRYLNPAGRRMLGVRDAELGGQLRLREFYPLAAADHITHTAIQQALAQGTWSGELLMVRRDGREFPVSQVLIAHFVAGEIQFYSTIIRNLSERKQSEEALAAALKHSRLLAELGKKLSEAASVAEASQLILEAADTLIGWDCAWVRRWHADKYRFERILGWDTVAGQRQQFESTTGQFDVGSPFLRELLTQGPRLIFRQSEDASISGLRPFGSPERSRSLMFVPMRHGGHVVGVVSLQSYREKAFTTTHLELLQSLADHCAGNLHRIHAEHALRVSEDRWRLALSVARVGTWEWDLRTNVVEASPELPAMFGGPGVGHLLNEPDFERFIHPDDRAGVRAAVQAAIATRGTYYHEFRVVWANGAVHWIEGRGEVFADAEGQPLRLVGISADVTERRHSDDALRQSETRFRNLVASMAEGLLMTDFDDVILFANPRVCDILGYTAEELQGRKGYEVFMATDGRHVMAEHHRHRRAGGSEVYQLTLMRKDGQTIWVEVHASPYADADGKITATLGAITDITDRKRIEAAEAARTARLRAESHLLQELALRPLSAQGAFHETSRFVTERMATQLRIERVSVWLLNADNTELRCVDLFCHTPGSHTQGTVLLARDFPAYFAALESGRALAIADAQNDPRTSEFTQPYLAPLDIRSMLDTSIRIGGRVAGVVCHESVASARNWEVEEVSFCSAVTDQLAMALANEQRSTVETQMRLLSQTLKSTRDCIAVADLDDRLIFVNEALTETYGYTAAELIGQPASRLRGSVTQPLPVPDIRAALLADGAWHGELFNSRKDGTGFPIELWTSVVRDDAGQPIATVGVARDISERRTLEAQFRQSQKMEGIGQLAGGVAHDFNNLLTVVQGHVVLLLEQANLSPQARESIGEIGQSATRAANLTRQLLTFSRRQHVKMALHDLNVVVAGLSRMLHRIVGEHIKMEVRLDAPAPGVNADAGMMEQALLNLVVNARDAMPGGGTLSITTNRVELSADAISQYPQARPGRYVTITVSDTGQGIPPEVLPHIFEPFYTTKDVGHGTGLGLATVFGIMQQHQGWATVYSEPGHGTVFRLYLPWAELPGEAAPAAPPPLQQTPGGTETILLVEDEAAVRSFVMKVLGRLGYRVLEAPTGRVALEVWAAHRDEIRLLLTDMVMPDGVSGRQLAEQIHAERPGLPVIYTSGYSAELVGRDFPIEEGYNFLSKPFALQDLVTLVRRRLDG